MCVLAYASFNHYLCSYMPVANKHKSLSVITQEPFHTFLVGKYMKKTYFRPLCFDVTKLSGIICVNTDITWGIGAGQLATSYFTTRSPAPPSLSRSNTHQLVLVSCGPWESSNGCFGSVNEARREMGWNATEN